MMGGGMGVFGIFNGQLFDMKLIDFIFFPDN